MSRSFVPHLANQAHQSLDVNRLDSTSGWDRYHKPAARNFVVRPATAGRNARQTILAAHYFDILNRPVTLRVAPHPLIKRKTPGHTSLHPPVKPMVSEVEAATENYCNC